MVWVENFFVKVFKGFFKFRNNDTVNNFVKDLISQKKDLILETFNNDIPDFIRTYKNSLLSFIYQMNLFTKINICQQSETINSIKPAHTSLQTSQCHPLPNRSPTALL